MSSSLEKETDKNALSPDGDFGQQAPQDLSFQTEANTNLSRNEDKKSTDASTGQSQTPKPSFLKKIFPPLFKNKQGSSGGNQLPPLTKKAISTEAFVALAIVLLLFIPIAIIMGPTNMLGTLFANAYYLLIEICFWIMAIAVVVGALSGLLSEFGVVSLLNKALAPLMKPLYGMPGASSAAALACFLSDNPAALTLASDRRYKRYFKKYQLATLTNLGTCFGMGLIILVTMLGRVPKDGSILLAVGMGVVGAFLGSIISTRLMLRKAKKLYGTTQEAEPRDIFDDKGLREIREGSAPGRAFASILEGAGGGVKIGLGIIPGVLIIANLVMLLTNGRPILNEYEIVGIYNEAGVLIGTVNGELIKTVQGA